MEYVKSIVGEPAEMDVTVLAVIDHNSVADFPAFQRAATLRVLNERFALTADLDDATSIQRVGDASTACGGTDQRCATHRCRNIVATMLTNTTLMLYRCCIKSDQRAGAKRSVAT